VQRFKSSEAGVGPTISLRRREREFSPPNSPGDCGLLPQPQGFEGLRGVQLHIQSNLGVLAFGEEDRMGFLWPVPSRVEVLICTSYEHLTCAKGATGVACIPPNWRHAGSVSPPRPASMGTWSRRHRPGVRRMAPGRFRCPGREIRCDGQGARSAEARCCCGWPEANSGVRYLIRVLTYLTHLAWRSLWQAVALLTRLEAR
jgi:hypothetical protein